ncbi:hypothetical protein BH11MYX1_BH11MYX1_31690 [soil metagenome]
MRAIGAIAFSLFVVACAGADQAAEPTLEITSPARGATATAGPLTVTGKATNATQVSVNGTQVTPAADGTFTASVDVQPGISIIESHAINGSIDLKDVRAVLAGDTAATDGTAKSPLGMHASLAALKAVGGTMATAAKSIDYTAAAQAMNPVYNNTGCLGATIDITSIDLSNITVGLAPASSSLGTDVTLSNVVVKLHASYKVACIGGSTTITVKSSAAHLHGALGVAVSNKALKTSVGAVTVSLDNFSMDVGGVPGVIENLFNGIVRGKVEGALTTMIHDKVPGIADTALAGLVAKPITAKILGEMTTITAVPTNASVTTAGLTVTVDTSVKVTGGEGGMALALPMPMNQDLLAQSTGIGLALAADSVNQLFAGLWAAGAFDKSVPSSALGALAAVLDPTVTNLSLKMSLPPTVTTGDNGLELAVGDLIVTATDGTGTPVQTFALSIKTTLKAGPTQSGKLLLTVGTPDVHAQIVSQADTVARPLTNEALQSIVTSVWGVVGDAADSALGNLPMPAFAGIQLGAPAIKGAAGYLIADIAVN